MCTQKRHQPLFEDDLDRFIELIQNEIEDNLDPDFLKLLKDRATKCFSNNYVTNKELQESAIETRRQELNQALYAVGLKKRPDSHLCTHWINGTSGITAPYWTLDKVVNRCIKIKWLYDHCDLYTKIYKFCINNECLYSREIFDKVVDELLINHPVPRD